MRATRSVVLELSGDERELGGGFANERRRDHNGGDGSSPPPFFASVGGGASPAMSLPDLAVGSSNGGGSGKWQRDHNGGGATLQAFPLQAHFQPAEPRIRLPARLGSDMEP
uniref:Uncharacterized protein n=1 Tax=Oryza glumipatula TaxID=40148 RepID=A0A0D9Z571_9ORYZ